MYLYLNHSSMTCNPTVAWFQVYELYERSNLTAGHLFDIKLYERWAQILQLATYQVYELYERWVQILHTNYLLHGFKYMDYMEDQ